MGTTPNYNIPYPESTDFVAQGAAAIEAVADGFDTVVDALADQVEALEVQPANDQTGTTYTLQLSDAGKLVTLSNAAAITLTVPDNATEAFTAGHRIDLVQLGAGQVTIDPAGGVTVNAKDGNDKLAGQYSAASLVYQGSDVWLLIGDLAG
jgi:hypothetical protein